MAHKGKKDAQDADNKRKEDIRNAVEPAVTGYEDAKKALRKAITDRRAAVKAASDPPPMVGLTAVHDKIKWLRNKSEHCCLWCMVCPSVQGCRKGVAGCSPGSSSQAFVTVSLCTICHSW